MLRNPKAKGSRNERRSMKWLEKGGFLYTIKSGGSVGCWDVIAFGELGVYFVQVKSNRRPPKHEMEVLRAFPKFPYAKKFIHVWKDHAREPLVEEVE